MGSRDEIRALLQAFQDGYTRRDLSAVDDFMALFTPDAEVIGTNGIRPGEGEWYDSREAARALVRGDWESWGDVRLDLERATIGAQGDAGWVSACATVSQTIGSENYDAFVAFAREYLGREDVPAQERLHYVLRGGTNTVYELARGQSFVWPLRFTAVVLCQQGAWRFSQMHFSFPTIYFPDVRNMEGS
ncbi:MAG: nuclear transport factor 2 family protein [Anaerolineae bacterium]